MGPACPPTAGRSSAKGRRWAAALLMSFLRHKEIYPCDEGAIPPCRSTLVTAPSMTRGGTAPSLIVGMSFRLAVDLSGISEGRCSLRHTNQRVLKSCLPPSRS